MMTSPRTCPKREWTPLFWQTRNSESVDNLCSLLRTPQPPLSARILYRLHRSYGIDRRYFDPAAPKILHHDVTGNIVPTLSSISSALCASAGLHAPRMRCL